MSYSKTIRVSNSYGGVNSNSQNDFDLALFCKMFIEFFFKYNNINQKIHNVGRTPFNLLNVISLLVYGAMNGITSSVVIARESESNELYQFVSNGTIIADRTLRNYRHTYKELYEKLLSLTLIFAYCMGITDFNYIALDGTILKAFNSSFNILKMKDIEILLKHFTEEKLSDKEISDLRDSAQKFLHSNKLLDHEKIDILNTLKEILDESEQSSIAINDKTARWMYNKQHNAQLSFNLQHGVDTKSNLICGINLSQSPTDGKST